jgi:regulator of protease activity HflC (stomatin/prohibitin superfamily)
MLALIIISLLLLIAGLIGFAASKRSVVRAASSSNRYAADNAKAVHTTSIVVTLVGFVASALFIILGSTYSQDAGEATVLKDVTGNIVGSTTETGLHWKAPWVDTVTFNIRNQQVVFAGDAEVNPDNTGGKANGPQITAQDSDAVSDNIDIAIRYSIRPGSVIDVYKSFKNEDNFKSQFIMQDVRSAVRLVPNDFSTKDLLTNRADVEAKIQSVLEQRWADDGVTVDSVSLQEVRPPNSVKEAYAAAQTAQVNISTQQAKLDAIKVSAQQLVVNAEATAKANDLLTGSLTPQVLQQHYLDTLAKLAKAGNLVITDGKSPALINIR